MKAGALAVLVATAACSACSAPGGQPRASQTANPPAATPAAGDPAISHADALLEDLKRREAAQQDFDRKNPPPAFAPIQIPVTAAAAAPAPVTASPTPASPASPSSPASPVPSDARDEAWWKGQSQRLQQTLDTAVAQLAEAEKQNLKYGYSGAQEIYKQRVDAVAAARAAVDQLHDDARRAGVPPAWLR